MKMKFPQSEIPNPSSFFFPQSEIRNPKSLHRFLLTSTLVLMPFFLAGARPWLWPLIAAFFLLGTIVLVWRGECSGLLRGISKKWLVVIGLLLAWPWLQLVPLPQSWLGLVSPHRLMWLQKAQVVTGQPAGAASLSYVPLETLFRGFWWLFLAVFALVLRKALREERRLDWLFNVLFVFAGFEAFYGLLQVLIPSLGALWLTQGEGLARGTFGNRNHYAAFLGMLWPLLLAYTWGLEEGGGRRAEGGGPRSVRKRISDFEFRISERGGEEKVSELGVQSAVECEWGYEKRERMSQVRQKQVFYGFVIGLMVLGIFFSRSRGGIICSLISLSVLVALSREMRSRGMLFLVFGCWAVMLSYGSIIGFDEIIARFDQLDVASTRRSRIYGTALQIIKEHLWTGTGLGSFGELFRVYQNFFDDTATTDYAHSDYLHLTVELGVPVAASLFVLVWGYWWRTAWRVARGRRVANSEFGIRNSERGAGDAGSRSEDLAAGKNYGEPYWQASSGQQKSGFRNPQSEFRNLLSVGALAGSAAFLCHGWVEFNWQIPADALYFVMLLVLMRF